MKYRYWFKSELFTIQKGEDDETNPGCYGEALGKWLCAKFQEIGYEDTELIPEDWGWCVMCHRKGYRLWIGCCSILSDAQVDNYDANSPPKEKDVIWHVFPVIEIPFFSIMLRLEHIIGRFDSNRILEKMNIELKTILKEEQTIQLCDEP